MNEAPSTPPSGVLECQLWRDRTVLISGGTSGTGLRAAERFLAGGANVVVNGRSAARGQAALEHLRAISDRAVLSLGDCAVYEEICATVAEVVDQFGGIDVMVSAGAEARTLPKLFADMTPDEIVESLNSRFMARMYPVHAALAHLRARPGSSIVMLTTDGARSVTTGETVIGAYGAGVIQATKTLARELARERVRVNTVAMTLTSGTRSWDRALEADSFHSKVFKKALERFPFGVPPTADDVANAVVFLASPHAAHITGQTTSVNGGLSFGGW